MRVELLTSPGGSPVERAIRWWGTIHSFRKECIFLQLNCQFQSKVSEKRRRLAADQLKCLLRNENMELARSSFFLTRGNLSMIIYWSYWFWIIEPRSVQRRRSKLNDKWSGIGIKSTSCFETIQFECNFCLGNWHLRLSAVQSLLTSQWCWWVKKDRQGDGQTDHIQLRESVEHNK